MRAWHNGRPIQQFAPAIGARGRMLAVPGGICRSGHCRCPVSLGPAARSAADGAAARTVRSVMAANPLAPDRVAS